MHDNDAEKPLNLAYNKSWEVKREAYKVVKMVEVIEWVDFQLNY